MKMLRVPGTTSTWPEYIAPAIKNIFESCRDRIMAAGSPATTSHMPESGKSDEVIGAKDMKKEQDRLMTFLKWPTSSPVGAERLARAGMFFTGDGDLVECFCCGGVLDGWNFGDVSQEYGFQSVSDMIL